MVAAGWSAEGYGDDNVMLCTPRWRIPASLQYETLKVGLSSGRVLRWS